ncbi:MAG: HTTM domain-containing protein [Flavipsychrobacter sp.]
MSNRLSKTHHYLFTPINNGSLIVFRILFGLVMSFEFLGALTSGWVKEVYITTQYNFTFIGFEFLHALHGPIMYWYYAIMLLCALLIALGWFYRPASIIMAILWTGFYFSQKNHYNNHYYLMVILCWLMTLMPANKRASLDVKWRHVSPAYTCARWYILVFIIQIGIMYTFAAIAKMNPDWLQAMPIKLWFSKKASIPYIGKLYGTAWFPWFVAYGGLLFDLLITPALLWKKTRKYAMFAMLFFHFFNSATFGIGSFPYMAMSLAVFFYPGEEFDNLLKTPKSFTADYKVPTLHIRRLIVGIFSIYFIWQICLPIRHHFIEGDVAWTEEGHKMAWRMMLRTKRGRSYYIVKDKKNDQKWTVTPDDYLAPFQVKDVAHHPDMIWQFAQLLKEKYKKEGYDVAVHGYCYCSLNGKPERLIIDPEVDLATEPWLHFKHHSWITPRPE